MFSPKVPEPYFGNSPRLKTMVKALGFSQDFGRGTYHQRVCEWKNFLEPIPFLGIPKGLLWKKNHLFNWGDFPFLPKKFSMVSSTQNSPLVGIKILPDFMGNGHLI